MESSVCCRQNGPCMPPWVCLFSWGSVWSKATGRRAFDEACPFPWHTTVQSCHLLVWQWWNQNQSAGYLNQGKAAIWKYTTVDIYVEKCYHHQNHHPCHHFHDIHTKSKYCSLTFTLLVVIYLKILLPSQKPCAIKITAMLCISLQPLSKHMKWDSSGPCSPSSMRMERGQTCVLIEEFKLFYSRVHLKDYGRGEKLINMVESYFCIAQSWLHKCKMSKCAKCITIGWYKHHIYVCIYILCIDLFLLNPSWNIYIWIVFIILYTYNFILLLWAWKETSIK